MCLITNSIETKPLNRMEQTDEEKKPEIGKDRKWVRYYLFHLQEIFYKNTDFIYKNKTDSLIQ